MHVLDSVNVFDRHPTLYWLTHSGTDVKTVTLRKYRAIAADSAMLIEVIASALLNASSTCKAQWI